MEGCIETYKTITDYPRYEISNYGNVRNCKGIILRIKKEKNGYMRINLYNKGKKKDYYIHRLVALNHLVNNDETKKQIDHIDRNKTNNNVNNLRWCNSSENSLNKDYYHKKQDGNHNIWITSKLRYIVSFMINKIKTTKSFKILEDAIIFRDEFILNNPK